MSPTALAWVYRLSVLGHVGAVVVWFGAVAYYLLILRPALRLSGIERKVQYALLGAIRSRLKRVVGVAAIVLVSTGLSLGWLRGLFGGGVAASPVRERLFVAKLVIGALLVLTYLSALPLLRRVHTPRLRGRLFVAVHVAVLALGTLAAGIGVILSR